MGQPVRRNLDVYIAMTSHVISSIKTGACIVQIPGYKYAFCFWEGSQTVISIIETIEIGAVLHPGKLIEFKCATQTNHVSSIFEKRILLWSQILVHPNIGEYRNIWCTNVVRKCDVNVF